MATTAESLPRPIWGRIRVGLRARSTRRALTALYMLLSVGAWFVFLAPDTMGGRAAYVMVSGNSMEPGLHTGDLVIARRQDSYSVGDVVAYRIPADEVGAGTLVIHRIIGGSAQTGYVLQGDNRETPDFWNPKVVDIAGKMWITVPRGAALMQWLRTPMGMAFIAGVAAFSMTLSNDEEEDVTEEDDEN